MIQQKSNEEVVCSEFFFDSNWKGNRIHAMKWECPSSQEQMPSGIVQIVHGMEEHIERYDAFARFLANQGFVVVGADHIGHGKSVSSFEKMSCLPENGAQIMISDVHALRSMIASTYSSEIPYFLFGHSMGSFVLRCYLARYGRGLSGAVICGTGQQPIVVSRLGGWLSRRIGRRKGFDAKSSLIDGLAMGSYSKAVQHARTSFDWLSTDPHVVDAYIEDPACGVMFSVGGYASLTDLAAEAVTKACASAVPSNLPVFFIAGSLDPVGDMGKGVKRAADAMKKHSRAKVATKIYEGMRHEILNEPQHEVVFSDIADFLNRQMGSDVR